MSTRKYAVLIYPNFSLQEITCLTSCLTVWFEEKIDIIASEKKPYISEDGFSVMPDKTVEETNISDYECLILPGTIFPLTPLFDEKLIDFLKKGKKANTLSPQFPLHRYCFQKRDCWREKTLPQDILCKWQTPFLLLIKLILYISLWLRTET